MLILIIVLLGFLWMRERSARVAAQAEINRLRNASPFQALGGKLPGMLLPPQVTGGAGVGVERGDLPQDRGVLDGRQVTVLRLGASGGKRLGFEPGDVIVVSSEPATAPAILSEGGR
jgi:hypothetical protein